MAFDTPAELDRLQNAMQSLRERGIAAELVQTGTQALQRIRELIPPHASLSTGASLTLREIGLEDLLTSGNHPWKNLKAEIAAEPDPVRQVLLRRRSTLAEYYLGSVHAVAESGEIVIASMTGSQIAPYAYTAGNLLWVVGSQKLTPTLEEALRRVREYVLPHEDARMREATGGKRGSMIGKILIFEREAAFLNRTVRLVFVRQTLGD